MGGNIKRVGTYLVWDIYIWLIVLAETLLFKFFNQQADCFLQYKNA